MLSRISLSTLRATCGMRLVKHGRSIVPVAMFGGMFAMHSTDTKNSRHFNPDKKEQDPLLFTPGPLTTSYSTKKAMMSDYGSRDAKFIQIVKDVRQKLLNAAHVSGDEYTTVIMQGSGTFGVESVISSVVGKSKKLLVVANGSYGARIVQMAKVHSIPYEVLEYPEDQQPSVQDVDKMLASDPSISHVACIHSETTSGIVNDVEAIGQVVHKYKRSYIVDAMSSFGGVPVSFQNGHIDFLVSSSNKCIEGVPGFSFVIAKKDQLIASEGNADTLSLDLFSQWKGLESNGQFRFTPPTHSLAAFHQALLEFEEEGGAEGRTQRYKANQKVVIKGLVDIGFEPYLSEENRGPIISSFRYPTDSNWNFETMYQKLNDEGLLIYPGKVSNADCFRIGHIGALDPSDSRVLVEKFDKLCKEMKIAKYSA